MNEHLEKVIKLYESDGFDFQQLFNWHLFNGIVFSGEDFFSMAYNADSETLPTPVQRHHADTLFVTMHAGDMRRALLPIYDQYEYICFQREFKPSAKSHTYRLLNMQQFFSKLR